MILPPSVLCPVDFSEASRVALRYAGAVARHFGARLTLLAVNDALLQEALELVGGEPHLDADTVREMDQFFRSTYADRPQALPEVSFQTATGKPAPEILRVAGETGADLIVMSSHGVTGFRKLFFGSTTERVLRETAVPLLVTPGHAQAPAQVGEVPIRIRRVLAPVDFTTATPHQLGVARGVAEALDLPILLLNVVEPVRLAFGAQSHVRKVEAERRYRAERELESLLTSLPARLKPEALVACGEPAEEIAKVAADRDADLIVMGLHSSPLLGPRMGSVTYRVLCLAHRLVLAIPPQAAASMHPVPAWGFHVTPAPQSA